MTQEQTDTDPATAAPAAGTGGDTGGTSGADQGQAAAAAGAEQVQPTLEERVAAFEQAAKELGEQLEVSRAETQQVIAGAGRQADLRVTQALQTRELSDRRLARDSEIERLEEEAQGDDVTTERMGKITSKLATLGKEAAAEPERDRKAEEATTASERQGMAVAFNYRVDRLQPTKAEESAYVALFNQGGYQELDRVLAAAELKKAGVEPAAPTTVAELAKENEDLRKRLNIGGEQSAIAAARAQGGPDAATGSGGGGSGSVVPKTQREAETLHVAQKITSTQMRQYRQTLPYS